MKKRLLCLLPALFAMAGTLAYSADLPALSSIPGLRPDSVLILSLTGKSSGGPVWGTDLYTLDSNLAAAAVHAGILADRQTGVVTVVVVEGAGSYNGSSRNGVTSASWGAYPMSFRFAASSGAVDAPGSTLQISAPNVAQKTEKIFAFDDWRALTQIKPILGTVVYVRVTGSNSGSVWGTGVYSIDSALPAAAVHAGILAPEQTGLVRVTLLAGKSSYQGSAQRGIVTMSYGSYPASYSVEPVPGNQEVVPMIPNPGSVRSIQGAGPGKTYVVWVTGTTRESTIWGTDIYTADSSISQAVVHAGILAEGQSGPVIIHVLPGMQQYQGTGRNGITSAAYGFYDLCYSLEAVR